MPFFTAEGYDSYALSFRGQGGSEGGGPDGGRSGSLRSCAEDVASVVASLPAPPVAVAHSFGGLVLQRCEPGSPRRCQKYSSMQHICMTLCIHLDIVQQICVQVHIR